MSKIKYILPKDWNDGDEYKGVHLTTPVRPDDTICGLAISDNFDRLQTKETQGNVTCPKCLAIINYCKENDPKQNRRTR